MRNYLNRLPVILLGIFLTVTAFALPARMDQPFMRAALSDLKQTRNHLNQATADKGGHRANAIDLTARAITAVDDGIAWDRRHPGSADTTDMLYNAVESPDQPNMIAARNSLNAALANLNRASADKGGYRERAIGLVNSAISEVNAGIEYDRHH